MPTYEQKLDEFAEGKRLIRLARPIRDRADAFCDACGSTQPRTLYVLEDLDSERNYFVEDTCLKELAKRRAVLRYGRHSGREAFENEMKLRAQEFAEDEVTKTGVVPRSIRAGQNLPATSQPGPGDDGTHLYPAILVIQTPEGYQAFASAFSPWDGYFSLGHAQEPRYHQVWRQGGEMGLVLEKERVDSPDALRNCINKAWEEATSSRPAMGLVRPGQNGSIELSVDIHTFDTLLEVQDMAEIATSFFEANKGSRLVSLQSWTEGSQQEVQ